jgi:hypothetical protein
VLPGRLEELNPVGMLVEEDLGASPLLYGRKPGRRAMAKRKQQRKREKAQRHAPMTVTLHVGADGNAAGPVGRRVYSREQAARALGVSLAEIARRLNRDDIPTPQGGRQWWPSSYEPDCSA